MSSITTAAPIAAVTQPCPPSPTELYRFNVDEYERMIFDDPRIELINGYVVKKVLKNPKHSWTTKAILKALERPLPPEWTARKEEPVRIPDFDEPEPDLAIVRGSDDEYASRHPGPADVGLLVEVSEATLGRDRNEKGPAYARGGIPVYWIINLVDRQVEVYTDRRADRYGSIQAYKPGQAIPVVIGGQAVGQIAGDDILR